MRVRFSLSAAEMTRVCERLRTQLPHPPAEDYEFIAFDIAAKNVKITARGSSEGFVAEVYRKGRVSVPWAVFHGVVSTLPYFRQRKIEIGFDHGKMSIGEMVFHNRMIMLSDPERRSRYGMRHGRFTPGPPEPT